MMRMVGFWLLSLMAVPAGAWAQNDLAMTRCDGFVANARNVDWSDPTRVFADGAIRFVTLDVGEPAGAAVHVMVLFPGTDDPFGDCRIVSAGSDGFGFLDVDLKRADASYDAARGLTVRIPASEDAPVHSTPLSVEVTVNQATGTVAARLGPP